MDIPQYQLFLGFHIDEALQNELDRIDQVLKSTFIKKDSDYLQQLDYQGKVFLGKYLGERSDLQTLHDIEVHIHSLMKKLAPDSQIQEKPLYLFPAEV